MKNLLIAMLCLMGVIAPAFGDITTDGTVIEDQHFTGQLNIKANNVTIRRCTFDISFNSWYGIHARHWDKNTGKPFTGTLIEDCDVKGSNSAGIYAHHATIRRCYVHDSGADAMKIEDNTTVEYCYVTQLGKKTAGSPHCDGIQSRGGSNLIVRHNIFAMGISEPGTKSNACLMFSAEVGDMRNVQIYGNRFEGGNYSIYFGETGKTGNFVNENNYIHDNYFGPDFRYGVLTSKSFRGYNYRQRRVSIDRNYWFDGTPMNSGPFDINNWDGDNK